MKYFNQAAIILAMLFCVLCSNAFPQTPLHYDTLKISFGYVIPDYRKTLSKDTTDSDFLILCPAIYKSEIDRNNVDIYGHLTTAPQPGEFFVGQLPRSFIDSCFTDKPGDTLALLGSQGRTAAAIAEIVYLEQGDITRNYCLLKPLESLSPVGKLGAFAAFRSKGRPNLNSFSYKLITDCSNIKPLLNSVKVSQIKAYVENNGEIIGQKSAYELIEHARDSGYCETSVYIEMPDPFSSHFTILANLGPKIPDIRSTIYEAWGERLTILLPKSSYGKIIELVCTFDLNDDGKKEYLVTEQEEELRSIIYSDSDSGWVPVLSGDATWQE